MRKTFQKILVFTVLITSVLFSQEKAKIPEWYPSIKTCSKHEMRKYEKTYNRFINTYHLKDVNIRVDSLYAHLTYIRFNDNFKVCNFTESSDSIEIFRNKIFAFYSYWWRIFFNEHFKIDDERIVIDDGGCLRGKFTIKHPYDPSLNILKRELGTLGASVDDKGHLFCMTSSLRPHLRVPDKPIITKDEAIDIIEGYSFTIDSRVHCYFKKITMTGDILQNPELSVYIQKINEGNLKQLAYRLVWIFKCQEALIYVDAITGEIIGHRITLCLM